jgi:hypothetical protein
MHWKFLRSGGVSPFTGFDWAATNGQWVSAEKAAACRDGIHACRSQDLSYWLSDELWRIELAAPVVESQHKVVAARARLLERVDSWTIESAGDLAAACVGRTAGHAADELRAAGFAEEADRLAEQPLDALAGTARAILSMLAGRRARRAAKICGYVVDAAEGLAAYPAASIAYIAARAANQRSGPADVDFYAAERTWQAQWLADLLKLDPSS